MKTSRVLICACLLLLASALILLRPPQPSRDAAAETAAPRPASAEISPTATAPPAAPTATVAAAPAALLAARPGARREPTAADAVGVNGRPPAALPLAPDFLEKLIDAAGQTASFALPDGRAATGTVELVKRDDQGVLLVQGRLTQPAPGSYFFQRQTAPGVAGAMVGNVRFDQSRVAFRVDPAGADGAPMLVEHRLEQVICLNLDPVRLAAAGPQQAPQTHPSTIPIPTSQNGVIPLQSLPGAPGVIYLDFDGETGPFSGWGSFDAAPSGATNTEIQEVWQRVCEDYQAFNLNITTDRRVFDSATQGRRQHVILTPTTTAAPGSGGVAFLRSFNNTGDTVCWSFYWTGKNGAEVVSHEVGHTLGLSHDGRVSPAEEYYAGHGSGETGWAPIMGVGYYQNLVQWSKGEYASANNTENDLAIIVTNNNSVDYRTDDYGATLATAGYLEISAGDAVSNEGIIETAADVDAFRFTTAGGAVALTVSTVSLSPDLDLLAEIYDSANVLVASANPDAGLSTTVAAELPVGEYTLRVSGVGRGAALADGYTDYASIGAYLISGTVAGGVQPDRFTVAENSANGTTVGTVQPRNNHDANPLTFAIASGNGTGAFAIDPATGALTVAAVAQFNYEALSLRWDDPATFQLFVSVTDATTPALNETVRVIVTVSDVNEAPTITGGAVTMLEHTSPGTNVFKVTGADVDRYEFPIFSITAGDPDGAFTINADTGQITVAADTTIAVQPVYTLTVQAADHGTPALTTTATVTVTLAALPSGYTPGGVVRTYFENISGTTVATLTSSAKFLANTPDSEQLLSTLDGGAHGDNFGSTLRGYLLPPVSGSYTFWIASDDTSELRISANATPASATTRATVSSATLQYEWTKSTSQKSAAITLIAGQAYYIEARHKESTGSDHVAVAWQAPGGAQQLIPSSALAPFYQNYAPAWSAAPYAFAIGAAAANGSAVGTVAATDANGEPLTYSILSGNPGGDAFAIHPQTGALTVANSASLPAGQIAKLQVQVLDTGFDGLFAVATATTTVAITVGQPITLVSPTAASVNIPTGVGLALLADNAGRSGTVIAWSKVSGPGTVAFEAPAAPATGATFSASGNYVLRCAETNGAFTTSFDLAVNVGVVGFTLTGTKVGTQTVTPSHTVANGAYTLSAAGAGLPSSSTPDDFYFVQLPVTGNVTVTARIVSVQNVSGTNSRAGVMIRESLTATARQAFAGVTSVSSGRWISRLTAGSNSASTTVTAGQPYWVRLIRSGTTFTAQFAPDSGGTPGTFSTAGSAQTIAMGTTAYVGLAATSGSTGTAGTAVFDKLTITPAPVNIAASVSAGLDATTTLTAPAALDGTVSDDGKPAAFAPVVTTWSQVSGPGSVTFGNASAIDTTASFTALGSYVLRLTAHDGEVRTFDDVTITVQLAPIEQWRQQKFGADFSNSAISGDLADPDFDGLSNLLEYALALDPLAPGTTGLVADFETIGPDQFLRLSVTKNPAATDITFSIEVTGGLAIPDSWTTLGTTVEANTSTLLRVRDNIPVSSAAPRDIRLKITHP